MNVNGQYQKSLDYIYSFVDYSLSRNLQINAETFNLERMHKLMDYLDNPQNQYKTIHVAGTKGKGSTAAFIANALRTAGYKTGFYTSPHLSDFCERIQINNKKISHRNLAKIVERMKPLIEKIPKITTFEIITAVAFLIFAEKKVDYAVIEVGLGGRLDATNIICPEVSVITSLSMDHMAVLGDSLEKIAFEKAGIIKAGIPVVSAPQKENAMNVLQQRASTLGCKLLVAGGQNKFLPVFHDTKKQKFKIITLDNTELAFTIPLLGFHQIINAATAYEALMILKEYDNHITIQKIIRGFHNVRWPARFEIIKRKPYIILDSAHNEESAERLTQTLLDYFPLKRIILIFGVSEDKDVRGMLQKLSKVCEIIITCKSDHPRAMDSDKLVMLAKEFFTRTISTQRIEDAIKYASSQCGKNDVILVTGSIFIAAAARDDIIGR